MILNPELGRHIIEAHGSRFFCAICSWAETSEALLFHGLQAAGSEPKAAKVDEGWLGSRSASSVSAPAGALWRRVVGLRYGGQQQKQVVVCWGGGGLEPSGSGSGAGLGQQAALHRRRGREKLKSATLNRDKGLSKCSADCRRCAAHCRRENQD